MLGLRLGRGLGIGGAGVRIWVTRLGGDEVGLTYLGAWGVLRRLLGLGGLGAMWGWERGRGGASV